MTASTSSDGTTGAASPVLLRWRRAIMQSGLSATTRHVLLTLSCFMNSTGGDCYPTTRQVAEATGLSERAVCTHIASAKEKGWLRVSVRDGRTWKRHQYFADWPGRDTERGSVSPGDEEAKNRSDDDHQNVSKRPRPTERRSAREMPAETQNAAECTERRSVPPEDRLQSRLHAATGNPLNDVQQTGQITPPVTHRSQGGSLNDVQRLTEPDDKNPLNDVQSTSPITSPIPLQRGRAREREDRSSETNRKNGLGKNRHRAKASTPLKVASGSGDEKAETAEAAKHLRLTAKIAKLPKHEREAAWIAAMEGKP